MVLILVSKSVLIPHYFGVKSPEQIITVYYRGNCTLMLPVTPQDTCDSVILIIVIMEFVFKEPVSGAHFSYLYYCLLICQELFTF